MYIYIWGAAAAAVQCNSAQSHDPPHLVHGSARLTTESFRPHMAAAILLIRLSEQNELWMTASICQDFLLWKCRLSEPKL